MLTAYIHFMGNCEEAMTKYHEILGGELTLTRYADAPPEADFGPSTEEEDAKIMHAQLDFADGELLMAADYPPGVEGLPQQAVVITLTLKQVARAEELFEALRERGAVIHAFGPTFFSPGYAMVRDRFGTTWMLIADSDAAEAPGAPGSAPDSGPAEDSAED
ncbi:VOC family protein [Maritimibacter alkaliphilus]|uniref:VOC family protein n=1 Tax=Maritimibacter alkaliphilus TaxID=404236 RepID=UPI001C93A2B5|nr:VOC family protein [Maritimibacter alkaliphilus]MBY6091218.1 VOC family protein [Maritimibacter alkaliphilus]